MTPRDPDWAARIRENFAAQGMMRTLAAEVVALAPGEVTLAAPIRPEVTQHHGYAHAAVAFALGDNAAGFAARSLMAPGAGVLTVEMKINLLAPAAGARLIATGRVERAGRRLTVTRSEVAAEAEDGARVVVALMQGTMMAIDGLG